MGGGSASLAALIIFYFYIPFFLLLLFSILFSLIVLPLLSVLIIDWLCCMLLSAHARTPLIGIHTLTGVCNRTQLHRGSTEELQPVCADTLAQTLHNPDTARWHNHICIYYTYYTHRLSLSLYSHCVLSVSSQFQRATLQDICTCTAPLWGYFEDAE